jgi:DNA invertase Pin-like site-specific DNA recombinase
LKIGAPARRNGYSLISSPAREREIEGNASATSVNRGEVIQLDRLARSTRQLLETVEALERRAMGLKILTRNIDTASAGGRLIFTVFSAIAEFEREIIRERTRAGLDAARSRGRNGGRPRALPDKDLKQARALLGSAHK